MTPTRPALRLIIGGAQRVYTVSCQHCGEQLLTADLVGDHEVSIVLRHLRRAHDRFLFGAPLLGELLRHVDVVVLPLAPPRPRRARPRWAGRRPGLHAVRG
jgi:hypothetical protein